MIPFLLGIACTITVQQAWKYRDVLEGWLVKAQARWWKP